MSLRAALLLCAVLVPAVGAAVVPRTGIPRPPQGPQEEERDEYELKAALLYQFARYTRWPKTAFPSAESPFEIAVLGKDPYGERLEKLFGGQRFGSREIVIRFAANLEDLRSPQIVLLCGLGAEAEKAALAKLAERPILLVGETERFAERGGVVRLFLRDRRLAYQVSQKAIRRAGIKVGLEVLRHAEIVDE